MERHEGTHTIVNMLTDGKTQNPHQTVEAAERFNEKRKKRNEMTYFMSLGIG